MAKNTLKTFVKLNEFDRMLREDILKSQSTNEITSRVLERMLRAHYNKLKSKVKSLLNYL